MTSLEELIKDRDRLIEEKCLLNKELETKNAQLLDEVLSFEGTLLEALVLGIIKLNFTAPPSFLKSLHHPARTE